MIEKMQTKNVDLLRRFLFPICNATGTTEKSLVTSLPDASLTIGEPVMVVALSVTAFLDVAIEVNPVT